MSLRSHGAALAALAALASPLTPGACGVDDVDPPCRDQTCPPGQVCGADDACVSIAAPATLGDLGRHTSAALLSDGRMVVATYDSTHRDLVVMTDQVDSAATVQVVAGRVAEDGTIVDTDAGRWNDLVVDEDDVVHAVWFDGDGGTLRYGQRAASGGWTVEVVDGEGPSVRGTHASLAVRHGVVHAAYRDETARGLRYARRELDGTWATREVDGCAGEAGCPVEGGEDYGEYASITVIGQLPRVAFYDRARGDLKMATRAADGPWETTTLDGRDAASGADTGDVGRFVSLALTPERKPGLAYYDASQGALRYLLAGQAPLVVDDGVHYDEARGAWGSDPVGQHVQLRYDSNGRAVMLYLDAGNLAMKQAVVSGGQIVAVAAIDGFEAGGFIDFDFFGDDLLRGAYGPWIPGEAPRTRLARFLIPVSAR